MPEDHEAKAGLQKTRGPESDARPEDAREDGGRDRLDEDTTTHPGAARSDRAEDAHRGNAVRERPRLDRMDAERDQEAEEDHDPICDDSDRGRRFADGRGKIVSRRPADPGPEDLIDEAFITARRIAVDVGSGDGGPTHVHTGAKPI